MTMTPKNLHKPWPDGPFENVLQHEKAQQVQTGPPARIPSQCTGFHTARVSTIRCLHIHFFHIYMNKNIFHIYIYMNKKHTKFIQITNISLLYKASEKKRNICNLNTFCVFFYSYIFQRTH